VVDADQLHGAIVGVEVVGGSPGEAARVRQLVAAHPLPTYDRRQLREVLRLIMAAGTLSDLVVHGTQRAGGVALTITITPQPEVGKITVREHGGATLEVPAELASRTGLPLSPPMVDAAVAALVERYLDTGHLAATGAWHTAPMAGGRVELQLELEPGPAVTIGGVALRGNRDVSTAELTKAYGGDLAVGGPWLQDRVEHARLLMINLYYDRGHVNVEIAAAPPPGAGPGTVTFTIDEGPRFTLGAIKVTGVPATEAARYAAVVQLKSGEVFARSRISEALERLRQAAIAGGHHGSVLPLTTIDLAKRRIDLELQIELEPAKPGP
jgi:outer membrane protein assembly factor BamA